MTHPGALALAPLHRRAAPAPCALPVAGVALLARKAAVLAPLSPHLRLVGVAATPERATRRGADLGWAPPGDPWTARELNRPVTAVGVLGLRRSVRTVGLNPEEPGPLAGALEASSDEPIPERHHV